MSVLELLAELVGIPSESGSEAAAADFTTARLAAAGLDVERVGDSVLARLERGTGPTLLLASHLDTVPVGAGWTRAPLAAAWDGERLYGRGAVDAKASAAAMISAVSSLANAGDWSGRIWLALTACEETSNAGMGDVLERVLPLDGALVGEPTGLEVARAQSGLAVLIASWSGRACHAAHVERVQHENALLSASADLARTAPYVVLDGEHALLGTSTVVPTVLRAGERHNVVPDRAEAVFDARLAPPHTAADALRALERAMPSAELRVKSERLRPIETPADHALVRAALASAGRERAIGSSTLSDMALLQGVPAVKCGPGESSRSHTPDEYVLAAEVQAGEAFYRAFARAALEVLAADTMGALEAT